MSQKKFLRQFLILALMALFSCAPGPQPVNDPYMKSSLAEVPNPETSVPAPVNDFSYASPALQNIPEDNFDQKPITETDFKETLTVFEPKRPTPSRFFTSDLSMPDKFLTSNNLAKKTGSFYRSFGEIIFLQGKVTDSFGLPVEGAVIEIWQANAAGKYHTLLEKNNEYVDEYFNMSGRTVSDNLGNYHFITIVPGSTPGRAPHINMNVYHQKFGKLETEVYFADHPFNETDYQYMSYDEKDRKLVTAMVRHLDPLDTSSNKVCTFNIVLRGIHQFKHL